MKFKVGDRVDSVFNGRKMAQGTVVLICSNGNVVVEADEKAGTYIYDRDGDSLDVPNFSVKKVDNSLS